MRIAIEFRIGQIGNLRMISVQLDDIGPLNLAYQHARASFVDPKHGRKCLQSCPVHVKGRLGSLSYGGRGERIIKGILASRAE